MFKCLVAVFKALNSEDDHGDRHGAESGNSLNYRIVNGCRRFCVEAGSADDEVEEPNHCHYDGENQQCADDMCEPEFEASGHKAMLVSKCILGLGFAYSESRQKR